MQRGWAAGAVEGPVGPLPSLPKGYHFPPLLYQGEEQLGLSKGKLRTTMSSSSYVHGPMDLPSGHRTTKTGVCLFSPSPPSVGALCAQVTW